MSDEHGIPPGMTPKQAEEAMFWLRSGMGLQADKTFLLGVITDLNKQIEEHEQWQAHANKMYDALAYEHASLKSRMRAIIDGVSDPDRPALTPDQEAVNAKLQDDSADGITDVPMPGPGPFYAAVPQGQPYNGQEYSGGPPPIVPAGMKDEELIRRGGPHNGVPAMRVNNGVHPLRLG